MLEDLRKSILPIRILEERPQSSMALLFGKEEFSFLTGKYIFFALKYRTSLIENGTV